MYLLSAERVRSNIVSFSFLCSSSLKIKQFFSSFFFNQIESFWKNLKPFRCTTSNVRLFYKRFTLMSFKYPSFGDFDRHCMLSSFPVTMHTYKSCPLLPTKFHRTLCRGLKRALMQKTNRTDLMTGWSKTYYTLQLVAWYAS